MQFKVAVLAGKDEISSARIAGSDPGTDVAQMLRAALQLYRAPTGLYEGVPELTNVIRPIAEGK